MEKINVRFSIVSRAKIMSEAMESDTNFSDVARAAMTIGLNHLKSFDSLNESSEFNKSDYIKIMSKRSLLPEE